MSEETAVAAAKTLAVDDFGFASGELERRMQAAAAYLDGEGGVSVDTLHTIVVPSGAEVANARGPLKWSLPSEQVEDLQGIILFRDAYRVWWRDPYTGTGNAGPPDCTSPGIDGQGRARDEIKKEFKAQGVGGECKSCAMKEFGTALKQDGTLGRGKACARRTDLYVLRTGARPLPVRVRLTELNFQEFRDYGLHLVFDGYDHPWEYVTSLRLEKAENADKMAFGIARPSFVRALEGVELEGAKKLVETWAPMIEARSRDMVSAALNRREQTA